MLEKAETYKLGPGQRPELGSSRRDLARIDLAENRPAVAEAELRSIAQYYESQKDGEEAASHYNLIALALLAQGKTAEAQSIAAHARSMLANERAELVSLELAITEARVIAAAKGYDRQSVAQALAALHQVMTQCRKSGFVGIGFDARLAEGEIELHSGAVAAGRAHLASLQRDATAKGFGLIAQQTAALLAVHEPYHSRG